MLGGAASHGFPVRVAGSARAAGVLPRLPVHVLDRAKNRRPFRRRWPACSWASRRPARQMIASVTFIAILMDDPDPGPDPPNGSAAGSGFWRTADKAPYPARARAAQRLRR